MEKNEFSKRIFAVLTLLFVLLVFNTILNPALICNFIPFWDSALYSVVFYAMYICLISITLISVSSVKL